MSIILFIVVLLVLVVAHEFGHFIIAKAAGIRVDEFAFGFPPKIWGKKWGETTYSFNALPLGGYVKIYGEDPNEVANDSDRKRSFTAQPLRIQASVIVGGVLFNLLLAWILITATLMIGIPTMADEGDQYVLTNPRLMITGVHENSPSSIAGIKSGDVIISVSDGMKSIDGTTPDGVTKFIATHEAQPLTFTYKRKSEIHTTVITPVQGIAPSRAAVGIYMDMVGTLELPFHVALWEGLHKTYQYTVLTATGLWTFLSSAIVGKSDFSQVTGPVGIVNAVGEAASIGFVNLLFFTALISINLAVINVIPFPALDGGRLLFIVIEAIMRRPINVKVANTFNFVGFALLMLLMVAVTYNDIAKLLH